MRVEFYHHSLDEADKRNVLATLDSVFLSTGPQCAAFEKKFSAYTGLAHVVPLSSCTAALHLALQALGIGPGDEVVVPAMTFLSSASAVAHAGGTPVMADVCPKTGLLTAETLERAVTPRTRAVICVHLYGVLCDMPALKAVTDRLGVPLIEDCAHCVEGERDGYRPGRYGRAACYSFYATKNLTCGEGGALATDDEELAAAVRIMALHGMSKGAAQRYHGHYNHYDLVRLGYKCNLDDIRASLLVHQLDRLDSLWERRHSLWRRYDDGFAPHAGLVDRPQVVGKSAYHAYTVWVDPARRDTLLHALQDRGVGVAVNFRAIHLLGHFRRSLGYTPGDLPNAEAIGDKTITLPFYPKLTDAQADYVITQVLEAARQV